jgi:polar amino acid transport system substrate-binding protein
VKKLYEIVIACVMVCVMFVSFRANSEELKFITLEVAPWAYQNKETGSIEGIFPDIVKEIENRTGNTIAITLTPYARINRELEAGRQDCTMLIREKERDGITDLGELVFYHPIGVVPSKRLELKKYEELHGLKVSVLRGLIITDRFSNDRGIQKEEDTYYEISLRKMRHGRVDAIAGAIPTIQYLAKKNGMHDLLGDPLELSSEPIFLQCSHKTKKKDYIDGINKSIQSIKDDLSLDKILEFYS